MAIKYYTDEHMHPGIAKALRQREIDVLTAQQAGLLDTDDGEHLNFSTLQNRTLVTQDTDFLVLHGEMQHSGIAYARQRTPIRRIIEGLILIYEAMTEDEMKNHVEYL